jgi:large subunit ribosomal protein L30
VADGTVKIKLIKSLAGQKKYQIATAKSLGLKKIGKTVIQPNNDATNGKIKTISHLVFLANNNKSEGELEMIL